MKVKQYPKNKPIRLTGRAKRELAEKVWKIDNYTCQCPFCTGEAQIDRFPHHIKYKSQGGADVMENLITLCVMCHDDVHRGRIKCYRDGWKIKFKKVK